MNDAGRIHVVPNNDLYEHDLSTLCTCLPRLRDKGRVVVHNAYDKREVGAVCRKALDALGTALSNHSHTWSSDEREAYEHAIHLMHLHWPEDK